MIRALTAIASEAHPVLAEYVEHLHHSPLEAPSAVAETHSAQR